MEINYMNSLDHITYDTLKGCFIGGVVGDCYGQPFEFLKLDDLVSNFPEFLSGNYSAGYAHGIPAGYYTDDTSMVLALADHIIDTNTVGIEVVDKYIDWYRNGTYSSTKECFDIGNATRFALEYYETYKEILKNDSSQGNGALMRMSPIIVSFIGTTDFYMMSNQNTKHTHWSTTALRTSSNFCDIVLLIGTFGHSSKQKVKNYIETLYGDDYTPSPDGWCHDTLYIAARSFYNTNNFSDCIIEAVSYGGDTDTNASVAGMIAGLYYGYNKIPDKLKKFKDNEHICNVFDNLYKVSNFK